MNTPRIHTPELKLQAVLESLQRDTTLETVCKTYNLHSSVLNRWRSEFREKGILAFTEKTGHPKAAPGESVDELKSVIGDLTVQNAILKKALTLLPQAFRRK